jgi:Right handed beta helix region
MSEPITTTCPNCSWTFVPDDPDEVLCPECDWFFVIDDDGSVVEEDPENERDEPIWYVNAEGDLVEQEPVVRWCPRCGAEVDPGETGAVASRCRCCHRLIPVEMLIGGLDGLLADERWDSGYGDEWDYDEEGHEDFICPACGSEGELEEEHEVISVGPNGSLIGCSRCGWQFEVPGYFAEDWEEDASDEEEDDEERRVVVVSPCGRYDHVEIGPAVRVAGPGGRVVVRPGLYEESISLFNRVEIAGEGPADEIILSGIESRGQQVVIRGLTVRDIRGRRNSTPATAIDCPAGRLVLEDCAITSATGVCMVARDRGEVLLRNCTLHDGVRGGLRISGRARATLEECIIEGNVGPGVLAESGVLTMTRCRFHQGFAEGLHVAATATVSAEGCDLSDNDGPGAVLHGPALFRRCSFRDNRSQGVRVRRHGRATLVECQLTGNAGAGARADKGGTLLCRDCEFHDGNESGVHVRGQALLTGCEIFGNAGPGAVVDGGRLALLGCDLRDGTAEGLLALGNAAVHVDDCDLVGHGGDNVRVRASGEFVLRHCRIHDGKKAGLVVTGTALGLVEHTEVIGHVRAGVISTRGANPTLRDCLIAGQVRQSGVLLRDGGLGVLERCSIVGNGLAGVEVRTGGRLLLMVCRVCRNGLAGVWVHSHGAALVRGCTLLENRGGELEVEPGCHVYQMEPHVSSNGR